MPPNSPSNASPGACQRSGSVGHPCRAGRAGPLPHRFSGRLTAGCRERGARLCRHRGSNSPGQKHAPRAQAGDPVRAADAMVEAVTSDSPPLHFLLGAYAYAQATQKLDALRAEMDKWSDLAVSTDYPQ